MLYQQILRNLVPRTQKLCIIKNLWGYVAIAFNKVDDDRLKLIGPDRMCAEWVLKNAGAVSFVGAPGRYIRDYNALPPENVSLKLKEIDASNSTVMKIGLEHLKNCKNVDKIILHKCKHLEDGGLEGLVHSQNSLKELEVSSCYNLTGQCLMVIKQLQNLKFLKIYDMQYVKNIEEVAIELKKSLPTCEMDISK